MASFRRGTFSSKHSSSSNRSSVNSPSDDPPHAISGARSRPSRRLMLVESPRSPDTVRRKVLTEGKTARNLVAWSVPVVETNKDDVAYEKSYEGPAAAAAAAKTTRGKRRAIVEGHDRRVKPTKKDVKALCWSYLFDTLHRAVDGIYETCEMDESVVECEEVIMTLDLCRRDFQALIERLRLHEAFEKADDSSKPTSLAWEVRKRASPAKTMTPSPKGKGVANTTHSPSQRRWADLFKPKKTSVLMQEDDGEPVASVVKEKEKKRKEAADKEAPVKEERKEETLPVDDQTTSVTRGIVETKENSEVDEWQTVKCRKGARRRLDGVDFPAKSVIPTTVVPEATSELMPAREASPALLLSMDDLSSSLASPSSTSDDDDDDDELMMPLPSSDPEETSLGEERKETATSAMVSSTHSQDGWSDILTTYKGEAAFREANSWADRCESPPEMRSPGRVVHLHQKLSSPSRKRGASKTKELLEEKQAKAQLQREQIQEQKAEKIRRQFKKLREVRDSKDEQLRQLKASQELKQLKAEQLRSSKLQEIVRKAQEEEIKVSEISFINTLEAQNRKMEYEEKTQGHEARLQNIEEERQRKREEQLAKEEAAQERRRQLEAERLARLEEVNQKKREQQAKLEQSRLEKEETLKEKARERERRREALALAQQLSVEELERKIQAKHSRRPKNYDHRKGGVHSRHCSVDEIESSFGDESRTATPELSASLPANLFRRYSSPTFGGRAAAAGGGGGTPPTALADADLPNHEKLVKRTRHLTAVMELKSLKDPERLKSMKKRAKKLRQRMNARARNYEGNPTTLANSDSPNRTKIQKSIKEIGRSLQGSDKKLSSQVVASTLDKPLSVLRRCLDSSTSTSGDQASFRNYGGFPTIARALILLENDEHKKTLCALCLVLSLACRRSSANSLYVFLSNKVGSVVEILSPRLERVVTRRGDDDGGVAANLMKFLVVVLENLDRSAGDVDQSRIDFVSYVVCCGVVDGLHGVLNRVQAPLGDRLDVERLTEMSLAFLVRVVDLACDKNGPFGKSSAAVQDPTQLAEALKVTELLGIPSLLYALLLHAGSPRYGTVPVEMKPSIIRLATLAIQLINSAARFNLKMVQSCLSADGIWSEFRLVAGYVLWYCSHHNCTALLHEIIEIIGYFAVLNPANQAFLQSGRSPTLLQLLCTLPFGYFSDPRLTSVLFPSLIAAACDCPPNKTILEQEMNCILLSTFIEEREPNPSRADIDSAASFNANELAVRFPSDRWRQAAEFFRSSSS